MEENLGTLKIEYKKDGNIVRLYNSKDKCSLVINGTVVDQYIGEIATRFTLQGKIKTDEKEIIVQAKMGFFYMSIFYDNICVAKKCMALG